MKREAAFANPLLTIVVSQSFHGTPVVRLRPGDRLAGQKWRIGIAFGAAVLIHFGAIVFAGYYYHQPLDVVLELSAGIVDVTIEPASVIEVSMPPPEVDVLSPAPNPTDKSLFPDERTSPPPVRQHASKPIAKARNGTPGSTTSSSAKAVILSAPWPEYPSEARERKITGRGVVMMTVDPVSGSVTHVSMSKSTGSPYLDDAAIRGFRRWRFKPGSVSIVKSPVTFALTGASK